LPTPLSRQAHWYNVRYWGSTYPPEITRRDDLVERPVSGGLAGVSLSWGMAGGSAPRTWFPTRCWYRTMVRRGKALFLGLSSDFWVDKAVKW